MARIAGVDLPNEKRVEIGLTYIFGIGLTTSKKILADTGINPDTRVKDLTEDDISKLREYIDQKTYRNRKLSRFAPQKGSARKRTALKNQRAYTQGSEEDHS